MVQLFYGDGKGKTTAAIGAAVRAVGSGMRVLWVSFFKNDDTSEMTALRSIEGVTVKLPDESYRLFSTLEGENRERLCTAYRQLFAAVSAETANYEMIVFDEGLDAVSLLLLEKETVLALLQKEGGNREWIFTGHQPVPAFTDAADYVTECRKIKHPYDKGILARKGIEY